MAGRRPIPDSYKDLTGSKQPRNPKAPRLYCYRQVSAVPTPNAISREPVALEEWNETVPELVQNGLLNRANLKLWAARCLAYAAAEHAQDDVFNNGRWVEEPVFNKKGEECGTRRKPNPALAEASRSRLEMLRHSIEFGASPASATRVNAEPGDGSPADDGFDNFLPGAQAETEDGQPN
jgi:phage terminase small subunit